MRKIKRLLKMFLGVGENDNLAKKSAITGAGVGAYWLVDYLLIIVTAGFVAFLRHLGLTPLWIFLILWGINILGSWGIVRANDATGVDFTLFAGYSRLYAGCNIRNKFWRMICYIALTPIAILTIFLVIIWRGAGPIIIFLKERRKFGQWSLALLFISISGIQMAAWTKLYILGLDNIPDLMRYTYHRILG